MRTGGSDNKSALNKFQVMYIATKDFRSKPQVCSLKIFGKPGGHNIMFDSLNIDITQLEIEEFVRDVVRKNRRELGLPN